ncbi:CHAT domain-containing tetratricopeptide repeat protein [Nostoc punctiforme UO1]|uniref:CHAT domain-containing protein n=1 Tax=Nostoc punctiforme TaxID=272131 RepID=UPI0030A91F3A
MGYTRLFLLLAIFANISAPLLLKFAAIFTVPQVLAQSPNQQKAEADRLYQEAVEQLLKNQPEEALKSWQQALKIYRKIKNNESEFDTLANLGFLCFSLKDYTTAINYQQQALIIARKFKNRQAEEAVLGNLGIAYFSLKDYSKAIEYQQQSLEIARDMKNRQGEGQSLSNLGLAYEALRDYGKAIDYHQQRLAIAQEMEDSRGEGLALSNLGAAYDSQGNYAKAIAYLEQSLMIAREIEDPEVEGAALTNLGVAYTALGNYAKAIDYYQQRLTITRQLQDHYKEGEVLGKLGLVYRQKEGEALGNLGLAYTGLGDYTKAIEYQQQSLTIAQGIKDRQGEGEILGNIGSSYIALKDYVKAIDYLQRSLTITREVKDRQKEGEVLGNLGNAYMFLGDYAKAIEYQQQDLAIAREIKHRQGEGIALGNLGFTYMFLENYAKAIEYSQQYVAIAQEINDILGQGISLNNLGTSFRKAGNLPEAEKTLRAAIKALESLRARTGKNDSYKVTIFEEQARTYRSLQQVLIAQNKPNDALEISEQGRARAFVELLASRLSTNSKVGITQSLDLKIEKPTLPLLQKIAQQQNATFVEYSIITDEFKIKDKQEAHESELYIWVIKPTGEITFRKVDLKPLWQKQKINLIDLIYRSRQTIGVRSPSIEIVPTPDPAGAETQLKQLHQLLIKPIADLLPTKESDKVIFIPQSYLFLIPFPALQDKNGKYLIEKHTILTSPSIQLLDLTHQQSKRLGETRLITSFQKQDAVVVGNPTMPKVPPKIGEPPQQLHSLPGAEEEAKAIAPILKTQAITGDKATKAAILQLLPKARIIHLATHGLLDDIRGLGSAIALAPSDRDDGLLTAEEIFDSVELNAELVVLSACDTGRGRITGDGIIGLSRSLISAGTPSVIVSLWSVPDAPTAELMTEFYQNLQKNPDKAVALRDAMLATMKQHPDPKNWAAFTLIGEAD